MIIENFHEFGAKKSEVGAFRKLLIHLGIMAPHSGQPFSEELLFGIGGGIGFAYFLFEKAGTHPVFIGTRIHTKETEKPEFLQTVAARIGVPVHVQNSSSANAAMSNLRANFEQGRTPIVWLDASRLPYMGLTSTLHSQHAVVVYGIDEEKQRILISDRCPEGVWLTPDEFRNARESSWSPKYRAMIVQKTERLGDVRQAVEAGIRDCVVQMNEGLGITNFGLRGMEKWATVLTSTREKKSWVKIFPPGASLFDSLFNVFRQIRLRGKTGSAYRGMYADFLDEASGVIERPALREVAQAYRSAERVWTDLADAHLPSSIPQFAELKQLTLESKELFETQGANAFDRIQELKQQVERISSEMRENFPLNQNDSRTLLNDLRMKIIKLRENEAECVRMLGMAVDASGSAPSSRVDVRQQLTPEEQAAAEPVQAPEGSFGQERNGAQPADEKAPDRQEENLHEPEMVNH